MFLKKLPNSGPFVCDPKRLNPAMPIRDHYALGYGQIMHNFGANNILVV